jgi:VIT1/CCC1 family predicted Fe2+/Mn2+ transporter
MNNHAARLPAPATCEIELPPTCRQFALPVISTCGVVATNDLTGINLCRQQRDKATTHVLLVKTTDFPASETRSHDWWIARRRRQKYENGKAARMNRPHRHAERHAVSRIGWLRAAVLGANDGIVSTASLVIGVAAAGAMRGDVLLAGSAGLVAGAMSMAAGEYVSVSSQSDTEKADLAREAKELAESPAAEFEELTQIYVARGLDRALAENVATQLTARDALKAHAQDELHILDITAARPVQAALVSAGTFSVGAIVPLIVVLASPQTWTVAAVAVAALCFLILLGAIGARAGNADPRTAILRVAFWGTLAMAVTAVIGRLVGAVV